MFTQRTSPLHHTLELFTKCQIWFENDSENEVVVVVVGAGAGEVTRVVESVVEDAVTNAREDEV
jgi:hypothetical protein